MQDGLMYGLLAGQTKTTHDIDPYDTSMLQRMTMKQSAKKTVIILKNKQQQQNQNLKGIFFEPQMYKTDTWTDNKRGGSKKERLKESRKGRHWPEKIETVYA